MACLKKAKRGGSKYHHVLRDEKIKKLEFKKRLDGLTQTIRKGRGKKKDVLISTPYSSEDISMHSPSDISTHSLLRSVRISSPVHTSMRSPSSLDSMSVDSWPDDLMHSSSSKRNSNDSTSGGTSALSEGDSDLEPVRTRDEPPQHILELKQHPDGTHDICRMTMDCIMPNGDIRVSEPGRMLITSRAYIVPGDQYPQQRIALIEAGCQPMEKRQGAYLADQDLYELKIKNVAVSYDGSVSILASLPKENFWSLWRRDDFRCAFGNTAADWVLNLHRNLAGQPDLPSKSRSRRSMKKGARETEEQQRYRERLLNSPPNSEMEEKTAKRQRAYFGF